MLLTIKYSFQLGSSCGSRQVANGTMTNSRLKKYINNSVSRWLPLIQCWFWKSVLLMCTCMALLCRVNPAWKVPSSRPMESVLRSNGVTSVTYFAPDQGFSRPIANCSISPPTLSKIMSNLRVQTQTVTLIQRGWTAFHVSSSYILWQPLLWKNKCFVFNFKAGFTTNSCFGGRGERWASVHPGLEPWFPWKLESKSVSSCAMLKGRCLPRLRVFKREKQTHLTHSWMIPFH